MSAQAMRLRIYSLDHALLAVAGGVAASLVVLVVAAGGTPWVQDGVMAIGGLGVGLVGGMAWAEARARRLRAAHEAELSSLREAAAHADRLASMGLATASIVHDLRGPLNAAQLGLRVLDLSDLAGDVAERTRTSLAASLTHMEARVDALLDFARSDGGALADPSDAVELAIRLVDLDVRPRVRVEVTPASRRVSLSEGGLTQVVVNLVDNGLKAGEQVAVECVWGISGALVRVHDDGPGVAPADRTRIFRPITSTRGPGERSGLGLHCVRTLVEEAGGRLSVRDSPMGGACFEVWLPWAEPRREALAS